MKLTDRIQYSAASQNDLIHIVVTGDTSQNPAGSSYKVSLGQVIALITPNSGNIQYWTSGSTGNFSLKTINDSGLDSTGNYSLAEGYTTFASGFTSHAEGGYTTALGDFSHAEGANTTAQGNTSHAEGYLSIASGDYSHVEGLSTLASGEASHAEGTSTTASGNYSHAEGNSTLASGEASHAEGVGSIASGNQSHAGGYLSIASGSTSFVHGDSSIAGGINTVVLGANITGNTANTTYVDRLNIKTVLTASTATTVTNLVIDSNGDLFKTTTLYRVYTALLTQDQSGGTPTTTVLENTLGVIPVYTYNSIGHITIDLSGVTTGATIVNMGNYGDTSPISGDYIVMRGYPSFSDITKIKIETSDNAGTFYDGILYNTAIDIRIYN